MTPEKAKTIPFIYLDCGTEDFLFQNNRDFVSLLVEKKVPHEYRQLPGVHDWKYWDKQVQEFLRLADRMFKVDIPGTAELVQYPGQLSNPVRADQIKELPAGIRALELIPPTKP